MRLSFSDPDCESVESQSFTLSGQRQPFFTKSEGGMSIEGNTGENTSSIQEEDSCTWMWSRPPHHGDTNVREKNNVAGRHD